MKYSKLLACLLALWLGTVNAHEGEDHGGGAEKTAAAVTSDKTQRLADGSVFVPKEAQHRLLIRTVLSEEKTVPRSIELNGHVVMDPNAGGQVQSTQAGRIEAGPNGLPVLGSPVRKGQLLAYLTPAIGSIERANQQAERAELQAKTRLAEQQLARMQALSGTVAKKEIEAAEAEVVALRQRTAALTTGIGREALLAPANGRIAAANVVNGQVVDAKEVLYEIVDPAHLLIEARAYDSGLINSLSDASLSGSLVPLTFVGGGNALRDGALPLLFRPKQAMDSSLSLGQVVKVVARTKATVKGIPLPATSIVRNAANEATVWEHQSAEVFRSVPVRVMPLDGVMVLVVSGLKPGARVVTSGATLINQIR